MTGYIKSIQLKNWFNFLGEYTTNTFEFEPGFNVIVAANDVGKTKLHNAFRWILEDKVILRKEDYQEDEAAYEAVNLNENNIIKVLNNKAYNNIKVNETIRLGIKLHFTEQRNENRERILIKEIQIRKEPEGLKILNEVKTVKRVVGSNITSSSEPFNDWIKKIIPKNLRSFFLVQGETLDTMTPLKGDNLKRTLTKFVDINILDKFLSTSSYASSKIQDLRQKYELKDTEGQEKLEQKTKEKTDKEKKVKELEEEIEEYKQFRKEAKKKKKKWKKNYFKSEEKRKLKEKLDEYKKDIEIKNSNIENEYNNLKENYILNQFYFSKLIETNFHEENLNGTINFFEDILSKRRSEVQTSLDDDIQKMLYTLEKSQPKPEILKKMMNYGKCYVCSHKLDPKNKNYIENVLIPYFKGELENKDDNQLHLYDEIHNLLNDFRYHQKTYDSKDFKQIDYIIKKINDLETDKESIEEKKEEFIAENGDVKIEEKDELTFRTFDQATNDYKKYDDIINEKTKEHDDNVEKLKELNNLKPEPGDEFKESKRTIKAKELEQFSNDLRDILVSIIDNEYKEFKNQLEESANKNFKELTKTNKNLNSQSIKVDYKLAYKNQPDFEVKIEDQLGNNMSDGGGASQTLRQLALVFGLIDMIEEVRHPFIADAPTSNMTPNLAFTFYQNQLNASPNQKIVMTKELWDDQKNDLNSKGKELLDIVKDKQNSTFYAMSIDKKLALDQKDLIINKL